jgi:hypothetical protein
MSKLDDVRKNITEDLNWRSEHASTAARNLALGVLALVWGVTALGQATDLVQQPTQYRLLIGSGVAALFALGADWLQAIAGYINVSKAFDRVYSENFSPDRDKPYPPNWTYKISKGAFVFKQLAAPLAAIMLLVSVVPALAAKLEVKIDADKPAAKKSEVAPAKANAPSGSPKTESPRIPTSTS